MAMTKFQNYDRDQCWPLSGGRTHLLFILELLPPKKPRIQPILTRCVLEKNTHFTKRSNNIKGFLRVQAQAVIFGIMNRQSDGVLFVL
jgi:hypothetical protein